MKRLKKTNYDLVISEFFNKSKDFFHFVNEILLINPSTKILVLTTNKTSSFLALQCLKNGVYGLIEKSEDLALIKCGIKKVLSNSRFFTNIINSNVIENSIIGASNNPLDKLTERENEFLHYFLAGSSNNKICKLMKIKPQTVSTMKNRAFHKLRVSNIIELMELIQMYP
ncbi:MAG: response regulator transcription factor [Chitinophagaceae bacterium]|nr:response regulator transcription factor [Chitinophagaceae bacterium]